ncbi:hypothetical protein GQ607_001948 [Colletotrichum asianum]|uniref:Uncharacterized protein n=1 Tax=Colletotrichum asianum TaxID=702518 RepID=A0A8H3WN64_9PEZI|nr:hypothetical protein GQ607_001948 [Colletotrichum asianum]
MPRSSHAGAIGTHCTQGPGQRSLRRAGGRGRTTRLVLGTLPPLGGTRACPCRPPETLSQRTTTHAPVGDLEERNAKWIPYGTRQPVSLLCLVLLVLFSPGSWNRLKGIPNPKKGDDTVALRRG